MNFLSPLLLIYTLSALFVHYEVFGATPILATGTTTSRDAEDRFAEIFNVLDFGAVGDGTTDDTVAIWDTFQAAQSSGGIVYFPRGTYLTDQIDLRSYENIVIAGENETSSFQVIPTSIIKIRSSCSTGLKLADDALEVPGSLASSIVIKNLQIDANGFATNGVNACQAVRMTDVRVRGAIQDGIVLEGGSYPVHLERVNANSNGRNGLRIKAPMTTVYTVRDCEFGYNTNGHGVLIEGGAGALFENVLCQANGGDGFHLAYADPAGFTNSLFFERITFLNCYTEANSGWGIYITSYNTAPNTFTGKIPHLTFINCSFNSSVSQQAYIRGTASPTIIGTPYLDSALDPLHNTVLLQTTTIQGNLVVKGDQTVENDLHVEGAAQLDGGVSSQGSITTTGKAAIGSATADVGAMLKIVNDGIPLRMERAGRDTWTWNQTGSGSTGLGIFNATDSVFALFMTEGNSVIVNGNTADASAQLEVQSTAKGFLPPRMTKTQRNAISSPANGLTIYQTDNSPGLRVYENGAWVKYTATADP